MQKLICSPLIFSEFVCSLFHQEGAYQPCTDAFFFLTSLFPAAAKPAEAVQVAFPVRFVDIRITDGISAVKHFPVAHINPNMGYRLRAVVCFFKEHQIARLRLRGAAHRLSDGSLQHLVP